MKRLTCLAAIVATVVCGAAYAFDATKYERVLFPVWTDFPVDGANGSKWVAEALINNPGTNAVGVYPIVSEYGRVGGAIGARSTWGMTFIFNTYLGTGNGDQDDIPGRIAYVSRDGADQLAYVNRIYDATRSPAFAVEIPVIRERDLKTSRITLPSVPTDSRVRVMLRVYDPFQTPDAQVVVRFWPEFQLSNAGAAPYATPPEPQLLGSTTLRLHLAARRPSGSDPDLEPGYAQLVITPDMLSNVPPYSARSFSVDIEPVTAGLRFWAFISVTDNDTQHVLTITPR